MESLLDVFQKLDIHKKGFKKDFEDATVTKISINKKNGKIKFYLSSKNVISHELLDEAKYEVSKKIKQKKDDIGFTVSIKYNEKKIVKIW